VIAGPTCANPETDGHAFTVVMLAGAFQILFGTAEAGSLHHMMPYTVDLGLMSGIGINPDHFFRSVRPGAPGHSAPGGL